MLGVITLLAGCAPAGVPTPALSAEPATPLPEVAAVVNGQPISTEVFQRELARVQAGYLDLGYQPGGQAGYQQQVLDTLIEQELIRQTAAQQGISVSDAEVDAAINAMIQQSGEENFNGWLTTNGYTMEEFREVMRDQLITSQLIAPVTASVPAVAEHVHARHILVNSQAEAEQVLSQLAAGGDFATLAAQYSLDVTTRSNGGDLGWFPRGVLLVPEVEEAAFSMAPGQISGVVASAWGFHIVQTLEFDPARPVDPETHQRLIEDAIREWRLGLRDGADIQILLSF